MQQRSSAYVLRPSSIAAFCAILLLTFGCDIGGSNPPTRTPASETPTVAPPGAPPIILVHGWKGSLDPRQLFNGECPQPPGPDKCPPMPTIQIGPSPTGTPEFSKTDFHDLEMKLREANYDVHRARLESWECCTPRISDNIDDLEAAIKKTGKSNVIIVAHSMGGVVARAYVETDPNKDMDVCALVTFGSPHIGVNISTNMLGIAFAPMAMDASEHNKNQYVMEDYKFEVMSQQYTKRNKSVKYFIVDGDLHGVQSTALGEFMKFYGGSVHNDGLVPTLSGAYMQQQDSESGVYVEAKVISQSHSPGLGDPDYFKPGSESRQYLFSKLTEIASACAEPDKPTSTPAPTTTVAPSALAALATSQPTCDEAEFTRLFDEAGLGTRIVEGDSQYVQDCKGELDSNLLAKEALERDLQVNVVSAQVSDAVLVIEDDNGNVSGIGADGKITRGIPGSQVVDLGGEKVIFYPPMDVEVGGSSPTQGKIRIKGVIGRDRDTIDEIEVERDLPLDDFDNMVRFPLRENPLIEVIERDRPFLTVEDIRRELDLER